MPGTASQTRGWEVASSDANETISTRIVTKDWEKGGKTRRTGGRPGKKCTEQAMNAFTTPLGLCLAVG